jgi:cytochrome c556
VNLRFAIALGAVFIGLAVGSEDAPPEHQQWMKDLGNQQGALRKGTDVEKNARDMQATLANVREFWARRSSDVAVKTTDESAQGAAQIAKAAAAGDTAGIAEGMKLVNSGCRGCHNTHREKVSETVYRIK